MIASAFLLFDVTTATIEFSATSVVAESSPPATDVSPPFKAFCTAFEHQQEHEVERCELSDLPLAGEAEQQQHERVHNDRPNHRLSSTRRLGNRMMTPVRWRRC